MSKKITAYTITDDQIRKLRTEAAVAGDLLQVAICDRALAGEHADRQLCADAINEARS